MNDELVIHLDEELILEENSEQEIVVRKGEIYASENEILRVIDVREEGIMLIDLETYKIRRERCNDFIDRIESYEYEREYEEDNNYFEISEKEMIIIRMRAEIFEEILKEMYPMWDKLFSQKRKKKCFDIAVRKLGISRRQMLRLFKQYLCSGRNMYSLADQRKFNHRPTLKEMIIAEDNVERITKLEEGFKEFERTGSVQAGYDYIIRTYYRREVFVNGVIKRVKMPKEEIDISPKQFRTYVDKRINGLTVKQYLSGERNVINNHRNLPGDEKYDLNALGQRFEFDECELPCYVVSPYFPDSVGKPVMYASVDVYSGVINGCYVSYDNNSCNGVRQLMLSMLEPHHNQTDKYGITYKEYEFPSLCMPKEIRCDQGSEYKSKQMQKAFGEMKIERSMVPRACGSFKGLVENVNGRIESFFKNGAAGAGAVDEDEHRAGEKAQGEACMTLDDIRKIVYHAVLYENRKYNKNYCHDDEEMNAKLIPSPANIYKFEVNRSGDPTNVTDDNRNDYLFKLLAKDEDKRKFSIGRKGIKYVGRPLIYYIEEDWFDEMLFEVRKKKNKKLIKSIEIRYEDTNIGCVYVKYKKRIHKVPLSGKRSKQRTHMGKDWDTYDKQHKEVKASPEYKQAEEDANNMKYELQDTIEDVVATARALQGPAEKYGKAPKENKAAEKQRLREDSNEIINRMYNQVDEPSDDSRPNQMHVIEQKELVPAIPGFITKKELLIETAKETGISGLPEFESTKEQADFLARLIGMEDDE